MLKIAKMPDGSPEIYIAIQGEGKTIGKPLVFVRCSTCNLHCKWCDTFYTWNFEGTKFKQEHETAPKVNIVYEQMQMTEEEVSASIIQAAGVNNGVVFTGGEPTIQQKNLTKVAEILTKTKPWHIEIETNGTMILTDELATYINQINCSPKLESSGNEKILRHQPKAIARLLELHKNGTGLCFKFVVRPETYEEDLREIDVWQRECNIPNNLLFLMPEGTTKERIIQGSLLLADICIKYGYNMSTRLQVILYGSKRAV